MEGNLNEQEKEMLQPQAGCYLALEIETRPIVFLSCNHRAMREYQSFIGFRLKKKNGTVYLSAGTLRRRAKY